MDSQARGPSAEIKSATSFLVHPECRVIPRAAAAIAVAPGEVQSDDA